MSAYVRRHLSAKLFLSFLAVILVGAVVLAGVSRFALPTAFARHMTGMGMGMGQGQGAGTQGRGPLAGGEPLPGTMRDLYRDFRAGFNEALLWAGLAAGGLALLASLLLSRRIVAPLRAMASASQRIAEGHYSERVAVDGVDELGQLAERFNRMAARLEQVEAMRSRLIADVSHELRTPLTILKGSVEGLVDGVLPPAETYEQIAREADRLARLVDDLQELSRVEAGAYDLDLKPVSPASLLETTRERLGRQFEAKGVTLACDPPAGLPPVLADADRIGQVLLNLAGNALHYTPPDGEVRLSAAAGRGEVLFSVQDSGAGIPAEHLEHVFDRFYRVDKSRSRREGGGSGIGLTIAKHLVEAHGGWIKAESEGGGRGSTFTFGLPLA